MVVVSQQSHRSNNLQEIIMLNIRFLKKDSGTNKLFDAFSSSGVP